MNEDDFEPDFDFSTLLDFDFLRAIILLAILIFGWRYYKKHKVAKQSNAEVVDGTEVVKVNYVVKVFEYLLIVNGILGIFLISSPLIEIVNNFPEIKEKSGWANFSMFVWFIGIFNLVGSIFLSIRLGKVFQKRTIDYLLFFIYSSFFLGFVEIFILMNSEFTVYLRFRPYAETEMYIKHFFKLIYLIPIVLYFKRSKRVKSTYI